MLSWQYGSARNHRVYYYQRTSSVFTWLAYLSLSFTLHTAHVADYFIRLGDAGSDAGSGRKEPCIIYVVVCDVSTGNLDVHQDDQRVDMW